MGSEREKTPFEMVMDGPVDLEKRVSLLEKAVMAIASELRLPLGHHDGWCKFAAKYMETHGGDGES